MADKELNIRLVGLKEDTANTRMYLWEMMRYEGGGVEVELSTEFGRNAERGTVTLEIVARYTTLRGQIVRRLLDYGAVGEFEIKRGAGFATDDAGDVVVDTDVIRMMLSITLGGLRGMIAVKTANTFLSGYPLPIYNMDELMENMLAAGYITE